MSGMIDQSQTIASALAGWSDSLGFAQFNPTDGTLTSVGVGVTADVSGIAAIENLGATSAHVQVALPGTISVAAPGGTALTTVYPQAYETLNLGAFDGTVDFGGTSGTIVSGFSSVATATAVLQPGTGVVAPFIGSGSIDLTANSQATLNEQAYGNLLSVTQGDAGAIVNLQYDDSGAAQQTQSGSSGSDLTSVNFPVGIFHEGEQTTATQTLRVADTTTGWDTAVVAQQFNPALGTLIAVNVTLSGDINVGLAFENLGTTAGNVQLTETAEISLSMPGGIGTITADPSVLTGAAVSAFNGTIDFTGPAGINITGLAAQSGRNTLDDSAGIDLSAYIGTGTVALAIEAISPSTLTGPSALAVELLTDAGATVEISYDYFPGTNAPAGVSGSTPIISGTQAGQLVTEQTSLAPFANATIADPNAEQTETVTVTLSNAANGTLTNLDGGIYDAGSGIYTNTGSAAVVTAALQGLIFTPASNLVTQGESVITGFTISDTDTALATATDAVSSVITTPGVLIDTDTLAQEVTTALASDDAGFTVGADAVIACFAEGTRIATPRGAIPIERLRPGQRVKTISGRHEVIEWIGRRTLDCRRHASPQRVRPVRIAAHAFGENRPARTLRLSPDHAVYIDGALIPVKFLLNGTTIAQEQATTVTYYHLELPRHDVVLAEGLPAESYLEAGGRHAFENGSGALQLHPDFAPDEARVGMVWRTFAYAPLLTDEDHLVRIRTRLEVQATLLALRPPILPSGSFGQVAQ